MENAKTCKKCGAIIEPTEKFCKSCGTAVEMSAQDDALASYLKRKAEKEQMERENPQLKGKVVQKYYSKNYGKGFLFALIGALIAAVIYGLIGGVVLGFTIKEWSNLTSYWDEERWLTIFWVVMGIGVVSAWILSFATSKGYDSESLEPNANKIWCTILAGIIGMLVGTALVYFIGAKVIGPFEFRKYSDFGYQIYESKEAFREAQIGEYNLALYEYGSLISKLRIWTAGILIVLRVGAWGIWKFKKSK